MSRRTNPAEPRRYATLPEAAEYIRSCRRSVERHMAAGRLTRFNNGRRVLVDLDELDALLEGKR